MTSKSRGRSCVNSAPGKAAKYKLGIDTDKLHQ